MVGGGNSAAQEALYLKNLGCNVKLVHRRDELRCEHHLQKALEEKEIEVLWNSTIEEIKGDLKVESVTLLKDGEEIDYKTDAVFIAIGDDPSNELAKELGIALDDDGYSALYFSNSLLSNAVITFSPFTAPSIAEINRSNRSFLSVSIFLCSFSAFLLL